MNGKTIHDWWQRPLRAVTLEFPAADVATIDVRAIIDEAHAGAVNTLVVFSTGYYPGGTAFYPSRVAPHYPGLGSRDLLAESIEAARRNGQRVIAYLASIWGNREMYFAHPDWAQRKADGRVTSWDDEFNSVAMDPLSPYREYFARVAAEISENYDVDGFYFDEPSFQSWSASAACQRAFHDEFGVALPTVEDWADSVFQHFIRWRYRQIRAWRESLYALVKRPKRCIFFQGAFPLASLPSPRVVSGAPPIVSFYERRFAANWQVPMAHGDDIARETEFADLLHFELYRTSLVGEPLWWYGLSLRYGQSIARGAPILVLSMMANSPFDLYGMEETELRLSVHEILANGGAPLFARYYPDRVDQGAWENVYELLREARDLEEYLVDRESIPYVALLVSQSTLDRHEHEDRPSHLGELKGFAKALLQQKLPFDVITEEQLTQEKLARYRALILPNASCLPDAALAAIRTYVAAGEACWPATRAAGLTKRGDSALAMIWAKSWGSNTATRAVSNWMPICNWGNWSISRPMSMSGAASPAWACSRKCARLALKRWPGLAANRRCIMRRWMNGAAPRPSRALRRRTVDGPCISPTPLACVFWNSACPIFRASSPAGRAGQPVATRPSGCATRR